MVIKEKIERAKTEKKRKKKKKRKELEDNAADTLCHFSGTIDRHTSDSKAKFLEFPKMACPKQKKKKKKKEKTPSSSVR